MIRRALIIYCDNTVSGNLPGPKYDNVNFINFLQSNLGGNWYDEEILSLNNPTYKDVFNAVNEFQSLCDYTFTIFTGHGFINTDENNSQYIELSDKSVSIMNLRTSAKKQTLIVDACRGNISPSFELIKSFSDDLYENFSGEEAKTRAIFDRAVIKADQGWTILYAASKNQSALDTPKGAAYLLSLLKTVEIWESNDKKYNILNLQNAHNYAKKYLNKNFETIQNPTMNLEKRNIYFPLAVKTTSIND